MTLAIAHSRGWLDYEERVAKYWPEFAQQGKERITVRQLLAHQAGLFAFHEPVDRSVFADLDHLAVVLARQKPAWEPGTRQAYHAITLEFCEGELLRRVDPRHRSLGQFFQDEIATPLGLAKRNTDPNTVLYQWSDIRPSLRPPSGLLERYTCRMSPSRATISYSTGLTKNPRISREISPDTTTMANGF